MSRPNLRILAGFAVIGALVVAIVASSTVQDVVIPSLYYALLVIVTVIDSLPQILVWAILVLVGVQVLLTATVRLGARMLDTRNPVTVERDDSLLGPVERYGRFISRMGDAPYYHERLAHTVGGLLLRASGDSENPGRIAIKQAVANASDAADRDALQFVLDGLAAADESPLPERAGKFRRPRRDSAEMERQLARTIANIEHELTG